MASDETFQCLTCDETKESQEMMKHLSTTRHKTIIYAPSEEEVSCEECQNNNIHLLQIIRFGGEDMSLLCNTCYHREYTDSERPTTAYSLSNGSILKNWDRYLKVRDCCCERCGNERKLNVNSKGLVLCENCLSQHGNAKDFVSEASGTFLYSLLGIQEQSNTPKLRRKGGRKVGRGKPKGRGAARGKPREKKPLTRLQEMAQKAYETKKINSTIKSETSVSLRSFKGVKAGNLNSEASTKSGPHNNIKSANVRGTSAGLNKRKSNAANVKETTKKVPSSKSITTSLNKKSGRKDDSLSKYAVNDGQSSKSKGKGKEKGAPVKRSENLRESDSKLATLSQKSNTSGKGNTVDPKITRRKDAVKPQKKFENRSLPKSDENQSPKIGKSANDKKKKPLNIPGGNDKRSQRKENKEKTSQSTKPKEKFLGSRSDSKGKAPTADIVGDKIKNSASKLQIEQASGASSEDTEDFEEGEPLKRFTKYVPKMSYPDLKSYFSDFSFALFLEERLENDFLQNFEITWPKNSDEKAFVVRMRLDDEEVKKLLPANLVKLGRLPFTNQQPLMLVSQDETRVWYTFVKELDSRKSFVTLLLELYPWNLLDLPVKHANDHFKLLPCSAQVNRIMFAMTRVDNPKFVKLILGNEPVKQLYFKNRLQFTKDTFNDSQKAAIQHVLNNSITVLQGPPGTGKTSTIEEIILQLIENFHTFPILCVAASNIAIDNIAEKFMENRPDIKILRIVSQSKEQQYNEQHMLGKICLHNIVYQQLPLEMKKNLSKLRSGVPGAVSKNQYNKLLTMQNTISDRHIAQAQIIFTTNIAAGGRQLKAIKELPVVIMDESTQSSEVSTLVPLSLPGIRRFVFVGDEKQLSSFSNVPQLEMSLFERVLSNGTYEKPHMLDTQYRMHPSISEFPIKTFYAGMLKNGVTEQDRAWPNIKYPLFFYQCNDGPENRVFNRKRGMRGFTYNNRFEADAIVRVIHNLILDKNVPREDIGVITPYSSQRDLISEILVKDPVVNPSGKAMEQQQDKDDLVDGGAASSESSKITINIINGVYVATVDSFQGHEKNFIIFSCVRNNAEGNIGFLKDRRRLNVALTRARNGLVLVGNHEVLKQGDPLWTDYVAYLTKKNVIHSDLASY
ncbi:LAFE_0H09912g1_1 [Lachancea fermentati]|uniref:LAFE_0H09912g1_1 n=1 Tax=Lachancea fermentati TaxID=4955 RepID=A0A1G4MK61_LACFM|nr:LAFE_0H09912g1_1 [Lachancea fermentati]